MTEKNDVYNLTIYNLLQQQLDTFITSVCPEPGAKFSKLLRKIFGRLFFQRKYADFRNFFGKCLWKNLRRSSKEDFEKGCAIFETSLETS